MTWGICHVWDGRYETLWDYLVTEAGVPMSWVYPTKDGQNDNIDEPWKTHIERVADLPGPFVVVSPQDGHNVQGANPLDTFKHPAECYYVFGSDRYNMALDDSGIELDSGVITVHIPGVGKALHSPLAAAMVIYDRMRKSSA